MMTAGALLADARRPEIMWSEMTWLASSRTPAPSADNSGDTEDGGQDKFSAAAESVCVCVWSLWSTVLAPASSDTQTISRR